MDQMKSLGEKGLAAAADWGLLARKDKVASFLFF